MSNLNKYYRAFKNYRKETIDNNVCERDRNAIAQADIDNDILNSTKYLCHIDEEWIKAIEEGLEFVEKAVAEERQFIRTDGEVVEIQKVKKISKDSVSHLARHSEMITHIPEEEGANIVPDKLYMVEKLSDYAVYENRFLFMMLSYIRDFINYRLERIEKLRSSYVGNFSIKKEVVSKKRRLLLETTIVEERQDNPFPIPDYESAALIQRIKNCQQIIMALLNTDLMTQVAKSPMIKPPITKTNVLKMNNNFKRSLALYDYIASYRGDGYTYEEVKFDLSPFSEKIADEIAESLNLPAFISYKYGNNIEEYLEAEFLKEEQRLKEEEALKIQERIKRLKKRAMESNKSLEEYMLFLEQRNKMLEKDSEELALLRHSIDKLNEKIEELHLEREELNRRIAKLEKIIEEKIQEIAELNQKYLDDIATLKREHEAQVSSLNEQHANEIVQINNQHEAEMVLLKEQHALDRADLMNKYQEEIDSITSELEELRTQHQESVENYEHDILVLNEKISGLNTKQKQMVNTYETKVKSLEQSYIDKFNDQKALNEQELAKINDEKLLLISQLDANRVLQGKLNPSLDLATRDKFTYLQAEFEAFEKFFKEQWKLTKKEIRKNVLWAKQEKKKSKKEKQIEITEKPGVLEEVNKQETEPVAIKEVEETMVSSESTPVVDDVENHETAIEETPEITLENNLEAIEENVTIDEASNNNDTNQNEINEPIDENQVQEEVNDENIDENKIKEEI